MEFIRQPSPFARLGDRLKDNFAKPEWTSFRAAIAFVKHSGTRHIVEALTAFSQRADVGIIAGIDHGGTSAEGLRDLLDAVSPRGRVIVFHNQLPFTFHPKIYLFRNSSAAELMIGSGNLTEGGLFTNYEAGLDLALDLSAAGDAAVLDSIDEALDAWADLSSGVASQLDEEFLDRLTELGLVPSEADLAAHTERTDSPDGGPGRSDESPFAARPEARAPTPPSPRHRWKKAGPASDSSHDAPAVEPRSPTTYRQRGFVMTLQQTDVGVGQSTAGTSRRSPETFVPLAARNADPDFWGWPDRFTSAPEALEEPDRRSVRFRLSGEVVDVNMMTWPIRYDFRLRSDALRSAGQVGDILHLETADPSSGYDYEAEVIPAGTDRHSTYLAKCSETVRISEKVFGYY